MKKIYTLLLITFLLLFLSTEAQITSMTPNQGQLGQPVLSTTITSNGLFVVSASPSGNINQIYLYQASSQINIITNLNPGPALVTGPDTVKNINFSIPPFVPTGLYNLVVKTQDQFGVPITQDTLQNAFTVLPPDGYLQGNVYEDINLNKQRDNNEPGIKNATIFKQPGSTTFYTDSSGNYSIPVLNGVNSVVCGNSNSAGVMFPSTDSSSFTVTVNNANISGLDFGLRRGLTGLAPTQSVAGRTIYFTLTSNKLFVPGSPQSVYNLNLVKNDASSYTIYSPGNKSVVDSSTLTFSFFLPLTAPSGQYNIFASISNVGYNNILLDCFTILPYDDFLQGNIYFDSNNNGQLDTLEPKLANERINIVPDSGAGFSDFNGNFSIGVLHGINTIAWTPSLNSIFLLSSDSASYTVNSTSTITGLDFGLRTSNPDYSSSINLNAGLPRCNTNVHYPIHYTNKSNNGFNGIVFMVKDPATVFLNATVPPSSINGDSIFWNFSNLQPFVTGMIDVVLTIPGSGTIQTTVGIISINGSGVQQTINTSTISQLIRCSFDPNDKAATPEGVGPDHLTLIGDWVEYLVRFQNTGTDTAFNVTVYDLISQDMDLSSFEMLESSHIVSTELKQNGQAIFTFTNILLPDSNIDEPGSHGFFKYRIKSNTSIIEFTEVPNTAFIVFDANSPVVTNTTINTMVSFIPVGLREVVRNSGQSIVYPNPFSQSAVLLFKNPKHDLARIEIYDILGNKIISTKSIQEEYVIQKQNLPSGAYVYRISFEESNLNSTGRFIVE